MSFRGALGAGALVLALTSRGDAISLGLVLAVAAATPASVVAVGPALVAVAWRWGAASLESIAGAQSVLGPAVVSGDATARWTSGLAALALALGAASAHPRSVARRDRHPSVARHRSASGPLADRIVVTAFGAAAGLVACGPGSDRLGLRALGLAGGVGLAHGAAWLADRRRWVRRVGIGTAVAAGIGALGLVATDAAGWSGVLTGAHITEGLAVAAATAGVTGLLWRLLVSSAGAGDQGVGRLRRATPVAPDPAP